MPESKGKLTVNKIETIRQSKCASVVLTVIDHSHVDDNDDDDDNDVVMTLP